MLTYQEEYFIDVMGECGDLIVSHWKDIALDQDDIKLNPDWDKYRDLADAGVLKITTAREKGNLVAYSVHLVSSNLHYKDLLIADGDIFWLAKPHRKGLAGLKLLKAAEANLRKLGVQKIFNKVKLHKDVGVIFERLGYTPIERVYAKGIV